MAEYTTVSTTSEIVPGTGRVAEIGDQTIAVFNVEGNVLCH